MRFVTFQVKKFSHSVGSIFEYFEKSTRQERQGGKKENWNKGEISLKKNNIQGKVLNMK